MAKSAMLCPKPSRARRTNFLPVLPENHLRFLTGKLGPPQRRAMREICCDGDVFQISGRTWLLAPVSRATVDALAAFEAEAEDREPDLDDEPETDGGLCDDEQEPDEEPDYRRPRADNRTEIIGYMSRD